MSIRIGLAGDWHHDLTWAVKAINLFADAGIDEIYHVGDFGFFADESGSDFLRATDNILHFHDMKIYVTPGNHEDYDLLAGIPLSEDGLQWVTRRIAVMPRGYRWAVDGREFVSLGGAASITYLSQYEGIDWWPAERITEADLHEVSWGGEADFMITHEAPLGIRQLDIIKAESASDWEPVELRYAYLSQKMMSVAVDIVRPKMLFHGHYHHGYQEDVLFIGGDGSGFSTLITGLNENGMLRNLGILTPQSYSFEWLF